MESTVKATVALIVLFLTMMMMMTRTTTSARDYDERKTSSDCSSYVSRFGLTINRSLKAAADRLNTAPFACRDHNVTSKKIGTESIHWDVFNIYSNLLISNAEPYYPNGIWFDEKIGGFPDPSSSSSSSSPSAREFLGDRSARITQAGKRRKPNLCTKEGQQQLIDIIKNAEEELDKESESLEKYLRVNCDEIKRVFNNREGLSKLRTEAFKACVHAQPGAANIEDDRNTLIALTNVYFTFVFDDGL